MNSFLERHDIDVARVLSVLVLSSALDSVYSCVYAAITLVLSPVLKMEPFIAWVTIANAIVAVLATLLGVALWRHRPLARVVVKFLLWSVFTIAVALMIWGPFLKSFVTPIWPELSFRGWSTWMWVLMPLVQLPLIFVVLVALDCPKTKRLFGVR